MDRVPSPFRTLPFPRFSSAFLVSAALLCIQPALGAGQAPAERVQDFLESASGFHLLGTIHEAVLGSGQSMVVSANLLEGAEYMVVGFCDEECANLDLTLFDSTEEEIESDRFPDAEPVLMLTAESSELHYVQVDVGECSSEGCRIAVALLGSTAEPGVSPGEDMAGRLKLVGAEFVSMGFTETGDERRGSLNMDQTVSIPLALTEGQEYRIAGVCDQDCLDLDLTLRDPAGEVVDADLLDDALPILAHVADTTAEHTVEVTMIYCMVEPCAFRFVTYTKGDEVGPGGATFSGELVFQDTHQGKLAPGDDVTPTGEYIDLFEVEAEAGQRIIVDLRSDEFDTFLRILQGDETADENDDYGEDIGHSHIQLLVLRAGTFTVQVTSFGPDMAGTYTLQIAIVE